MLILKLQSRKLNNACVSCTVQLIALHLVQESVLRTAQLLLLSLIDYADIVYHSSSVTSLKALDLLFNSICRFVLRYPFMTHHCTLYEKLDWLQPIERRRYHWYMFIFNCTNYANKCPPYLQQYFVRHISVYPIRHLRHPFFATPRIHWEIG